MRHSFLLSSVVVGTAMLLACNSILDFDAYTVEKQQADGGKDETDAAPVGDECSTNQDCITKIGDYSICRKSDHACVKLLSPECPKILGNWKNDDAVILGAIQPLLGSDAAAGIPTENGISVAVDDFTQGSNGLPAVGSTGRRRPIAVVSCTEATEDENDNDAPIRSAQHLIDIGVPAIIGAAYSGDTLRISEKTINAGVLIMSPTATSVALTDLQDNGLVWRTSPSDVIQASALTGVMPQIEAQTRERAGLAAADPLRVWILNKGDTYGKGLADAIKDTLRYNGKTALEQIGSSFVIKDYGDPDSQQPPPAYAERKADVLKAIQDGVAPHVMFLLGTTEVITDLLQGVEELSAWGAKPKPMYLLADGALVPELWEYVAAKSDLRTRVFGTIPGTNNANFQTFKLLYESKIKDGTSPAVGGASNAYDALYVIAYAIASLGDEPVTGANIAKGLRRVVGPGQPSRPGSNNINTALSLIAAGQNIDYDGASGPLDFDLDKGEAPSDIQLWCMPDSGGKAGPAVNSGVFYDAAKEGLNDLKLYPPSDSVVAACTLPTPTP